MKRKLVGALLMLCASAFIACGSSSTSSDDANDDHCTKDPLAPGCVIEEDEPVDAE